MHVRCAGQRRAWAHPLGRLKGDLLQDALQHRVQPPRADVVHRAVDLLCHARHLRRARPPSFKPRASRHQQPWPLPFGSGWTSDSHDLDGQHSQGVRARASWMASSVKCRSMPSVASSACCCRIMLFSGSVRMRMKSSFLRRARHPLPTWSSHPVSRGHKTPKPQPDVYHLTHIPGHAASAQQSITCMQMPATCTKFGNLRTKRART